MEIAQLDASIVPSKQKKMQKYNKAIEKDE